jgi:RNA polymerase sigma-70 factor (ECF subfamily)
VHTYLNDRTVQETARILGIPPGTVKSRQHYALRQLRNRIRMTAEQGVPQARDHVTQADREQAA